ncbi:hypothetical protein KRZ98_17880 [Sphingobium sp. AS12]|uniref:hypothetical protein n=1 Tax=Sphingobium sp. AS12 TaxID=2849495 RepID=UPI001C31E85F|nr:hypothetical protein [Sphingobium sp. AS12]MBV2150116.1 hypothetical protein [Sphingobium sp. AS12]
MTDTGFRIVGESRNGMDGLAGPSCAVLAAGHLVELAPARPGPDNRLCLVRNKTVLRRHRVVHVRDFLLRARSM